MPPSVCGAGNAIAFAATPCVGWGRNLPIIPSASFVNVLIFGTLQMLSSKESTHHRMGWVFNKVLSIT